MQESDWGQFHIIPFYPYFIDLGSSRHRASGPGSEAAIIHDYASAGGHYDPPEGLENVDPFAYDIYALGVCFEEICEVGAHFVCCKYSLAYWSADRPELHGYPHP